jgi:hypothetical protein
MIAPSAMTPRPSFRARSKAGLQVLIVPAAWLLVALDLAEQSPSKLSQFLVGLTLGSNVALWIDTDDILSFPWLRRLLAAAQAATLVATFMLILDWTSGVLAGYAAVDDAGNVSLPTPKPPVDIASALFSSRTAAWAFFSFALWLFLLRLHRHRAEAATQAQLRRAAEDSALRARLAPHFIFNALNTLKAQIELSPGEAAATADRLASLFRQVLALTDRPTIPLREELAFVEAYLGIERARLGQRLRVKFEVPEALEAVEVPSLSLQVLVENAVKHGIAPREEGGEVLIWARWSGPGSGRRVLVGVESPAPPGPQPATTSNGTGTGLQALRGRLEKPDDLVIDSRGGLYRAQFSCRGLAA